MDRRSFLIGAGALTAALAHPVVALGGEAAWHVLYPGTTTREDAQELLERVARHLGPQVAQHLQIAKRGDTFVVIYDRGHLQNGDERATADAVARRHAELLRAVLDDDGPLATVVSSEELLDAWNVRYGAPGSKDALQDAWTVVARMLGVGVAKRLVIETLPDGRHQLIYRRLGDRSSTEGVATHHARLLRGVSLAATAVPDQFHVVAFDGSSAELDACDLCGDSAEIEDTGDVLTSGAVHTSLRDAINAHIQKLRGRGALSSVERTAWVVHDLSSDETLCAINADVPLQAASMIKPFVALAFFHLAHTRKLIYGRESRSHMERMIRDSSNSSTNWLLRQVGGPRSCHQLLHRHFDELVKQLHLVEYIPAGGRTYRNKASANDYARLLRAVWKDEVPYAAELRRVMNLPSGDRLYRDVPVIPVGTEVYNKTGTTAMCCGDMGILVARTRSGKRVPYIVVGVIERASRTDRYTSWSRSRGNVIRSVSGLTYRYLKGVYDFV